MHLNSGSITLILTHIWDKKYFDYKSWVVLKMAISELTQIQLLDFHYTLMCRLFNIDHIKSFNTKTIILSSYGEKREKTLNPAVFAVILADSFIQSLFLHHVLNCVRHICRQNS